MPAISTSNAATITTNRLFSANSTSLRIIFFPAFPVRCYSLSITFWSVAALVTTCCPGFSPVRISCMLFGKLSAAG